MATRPVIAILDACTALDALTTALGASPTIKVYTGAQPTKTTDSEGGILLATLTMSATPFAASTHSTTDGLATATANAITSETNAPNSGTAGHFRLAASGGTVHQQGNVGTSGCDLNFNTAVIAAGDTIAITSLKETLPCGDGAS